VEDGIKPVISLDRFSSALSAARFESFKKIHIEDIIRATPDNTMMTKNPALGEHDDARSADWKSQGHLNGAAVIPGQ